MVTNGSGTRDSGRVLGIDKDTVTNILKKNNNFPKQVNKAYLEKHSEEIEVDIFYCTEQESSKSEKSNKTEVEMDEMWSYYHDKKHQVWLWWAVEHKTNIPLAYIFGTREHKYLDELLKLLSPFNIVKVYANNNFA